jgi:pyrimidine operon attenuation protein/uracil phosphoribosyltransferase
LNTLPDVDQLIDEMASTLREHLTRNCREDVAFVGIHTGGVWIAERLRERCLPAAPLGTLDIAFYRDDFEQHGLPQRVRPSELPFSVDDRHLVLIDDVLMTGRTIRAALNELFDYGRPASVTLVTLIDIEARQLPIRADVRQPGSSARPADKIDRPRATRADPEPEPMRDT